MTTVETIQTAITVEEVKAALLESGKVRDMASLMMTLRENGRFKTMSAEEKYEAMKTLKAKNIVKTIYSRGRPKR